MADITEKHVFFVDDEPRVCKVAGRALEQLGLKVSCFASGDDCLEALHSKTCDILVTDVKMPGMSGMDLLTEAKRRLPTLPVLVITGYGDIPLAVKAMRTGALDFIEKPLDRESFLSAVQSALSRKPRHHRSPGSMLTKVETEVLRLIMDGKSTKEIAKVRHRSVRTIEDERASIMRKLGVDNLVDLVKQVADVRPIEPAENEQRR